MLFININLYKQTENPHLAGKLNNSLSHSDVLKKDLFYTAIAT